VVCGQREKIWGGGQLTKTTRKKDGQLSTPRLGAFGLTETKTGRGKRRWVSDPGRLGVWRWTWSGFHKTLTNPVHASLSESKKNWQRRRSEGVYLKLEAFRKKNSRFLFWDKLLEEEGYKKGTHFPAGLKSFL